MPIPQLPADKANHYLFGTLAATVSAPIGQFLGLPRDVSALLGSVTAGILKEVADLAANLIAVKQGKEPQHTVDPWDFVATAAGGLPVAGFDRVL